MDPTSRAAAAVCYRHPDRPTRLSCSTCGRPICAECSHDAVVGQRCPECATPAAPTQVIRPQAITHVDRRTTPLTIALMVVNLGVFLVGEFFPEVGRDLYREGSQFRPFIEQGEWWRALSAMFLHSDFMHIIFNMWALWLFGPTIERRFGTLPFASLYLAAGLNGAALFHLIGRAGPAVGASGAIFGLFGALMAASYRQRHTPAGQAVFGQLALLLALNLALPLFVPRIAWEAHLGGLIAGVVLAAVWDRMPRGVPGVAVQRSTIGFILAATAMLLVVFT